MMQFAESFHDKKGLIIHISIGILYIKNNIIKITFFLNSQYITNFIKNKQISGIS
jgi:hypothetical protein